MRVFGEVLVGGLGVFVTPAFHLSLFVSSVKSWVIFSRPPKPSFALSSQIIPIVVSDEEKKNLFVSEEDFQVFLVCHVQLSIIVLGLQTLSHLMSL